MALGVMLTRPRLAAGVISLSGVLRAVEQLDLAAPEELRGLPVFAAHGLYDPLVSIALGRSVRDELQRLGLALEWHEYPMGHMVTAEELADARAWLAPRL
jgi:phospholipase/carboxylesterase